MFRRGVGLYLFLFLLLAGLVVRCGGLGIELGLDMRTPFLDVFDVLFAILDWFPDLLLVGVEVGFCGGLAWFEGLGP